MTWKQKSQEGVLPASILAQRSARKIDWRIYPVMSKISLRRYSCLMERRDSPSLLLSNILFSTIIKPSLQIVRNFTTPWRSKKLCAVMSMTLRMTMLASQSPKMKQGLVYWERRPSARVPSSSNVNLKRFISKFKNCSTFASAQINSTITILHIWLMPSALLLVTICWRCRYSTLILYSETLQRGEFLNHSRRLTLVNVGNNAWKLRNIEAF